MFRSLALVLGVATFTVTHAETQTNPLYWPFLSNGYSTYHADAFRSDSTWIEPASSYAVHQRQGSNAIVFVTANLDYDLGRAYFPVPAAPNSPKIYAYDEVNPGFGRSLWGANALTTSVDNCAFPYSQTIDVDHNLYFSDCRFVYSATPAGQLRWKTAIPRDSSQLVSFIELFFTSKGDVGGVTSAGLLALFDRQTGAQKLAQQLPQIRKMEGPAATAIANAPASMLDPVNPAITRVFVTGTLESDPDGDGVYDLGVYREDVRYSSAAPSSEHKFLTVIPNGNISATTPTISPDGREVYVSDKTRNLLWAVSTEDGRILWSAEVGRQQGSVAVGRNPADYKIFTGAGNRELVILDPRASVKVKARVRYDSLAERFVPARGNLKRTSLISTNILATPSRLLFVVTVGYDTSTAAKEGLMPVWPVSGVFVVADHSGQVLHALAIPTTSDVTLSIQPDKKVFIPSSNLQTLACQAAAKKDPSLIELFGEPLRPLGGLFVLTPR